MLLKSKQNSVVELPPVVASTDGIEQALIKEEVDENNSSPASETPAS
jgi:hypothetical protein